MPRLGQHFLVNKSAIGKIISAIDPQPGEIIIEIGPGHGELTLPLAKKCAEVGSGVIALERDAALARGLELAAREEKIPNLKIEKGDALKLLPNAARQLPTPSWKLCGNIPYYITGHLLRIVGNLGKRPVASVFTVQKEVGERLAARPPVMNRLAAALQIWGEPKLIRTLPREDFHPMPEVDSAIVRIETRADAPPESEQKIYESAVRALFQQPRQTVLNNLARAKLKKPAAKEKLAERLAEIEIRASDRPQNLSIKDIKKIAAAFFSG